MATIDDRVVSMAFENSKFESRVRTTLSSLDKLRNALRFDGASKGLQGISAAAKKTDLSPISRGIDALNSKFGALRVAGVAVISSIAVKASQAGAQIVKSFTLDPVIGGLHEYEGQIQSIQTILANTQAAGTNLKDVNKALAELNTYADKTIYNFGQMTKNIGTFTAAGVDLETATASIKGIANLAALSGSSAEQAATAMYQLSQAISAGRVSLQDWNSVVNAGMGGSVFQRALANTAVAMGELDKSALSLEGKMKNVKIEGQSFRESIMAAPGKQSWLTGDVLTNTLQQLSGELSKAELKAQGFSEAQIKAIQKQAKAAVDAATTVKTFSQLMDTTKEALGSGWAKTWQIIFGDFGEAKRLFTDLSNAISGFVGKSAKARNSVLQDWKDLGGRTLLIQSFKEAFQALGRILEPIKDAFRDIFPAKTGKDLLNLTDRFHDFVQILKIGPDTVVNLRRTFRGFFAILDIGKEIIQGIFAGIGKMFDAFGEGSGGILNLTGNIGDLIVHFRNWLKEGDKITHFFETLGSVLAVPIQLIGELAGALAGLFGSGDSGAGDSLAGMGKSLEGTSNAASAAEQAMSAFHDVLKKIGDIVGPIFENIGQAFQNLPDAIGDALSSANYDNVFKIIQTTLIGGIFLAIKKAIGGGLSIDFGGGVLSNLTGSLDTLNGSLKAIQTNIKANTLLQIGAAVALLAASVTALSLIDPEKLASAMTAVTVGIGQLVGAMALLQKFGAAGALQAAGVIGSAGSLILLAAALTILTIPLVVLSRLDWEQLAKGLVGLGGMLLGISLATKPLSAAGPGLIAAGLGITALSIGLTILSGAMKILASMSWEEMAQGLLGVAGALVAIGTATKLIGPQILLVGPGLIAVGIALGLLGAAVKIFASMDLLQMGKGILGVGAALVTIALAVGLMPPTLPLTAAGLILVGIALNGIAVAIGLLGGMDISTLAKGIGAIGIALVVLAGGLTLMIASLPGAAALAVTAAALAVLVPLIGILGTMNIGTIIKGLGAMVLTLVALGVAGTIAAPGLTMLGIALTALGLGLTLVSAAVYLLVKGLVKLAGEGAQGIGVVIAAFTAFIALLPKIIIDFLKGLVQIVAEIAKIAPEVVASAVKIAVAMLDGLIKMAPKFGEVAIAFIGAMLKVIRQKVPDFIRTGLVIIVALLRGIENNIGKITESAINIIIKFLKALTARLPSLIDAGADTLIAFLKGIAKNIGKVTKAAFDVVVQFVKAIGNNLPRVVKAGLDIPIKLIKGIGNKSAELVKAGGEAVGKFIRGVGNAGSKIVTSAVEAAGRFMRAISRALVRLADVGAIAIINFLHGVARVIREREPELLAAGFEIGVAIIQGFLAGLASLADKLYEKIKDIANDVKNIAEDALSVLSPSKVFYDIGKYVVQGLINGLDDHAPGSRAASARLAENIVASFSSKIVKLTKGQESVLSQLGTDLTKVFFAPILGIDQELDQVQQGFADMLERIETRLSESNDRIIALRSKREAANKKIDSLEKNRHKSRNQINKLEKRQEKLEQGKENEKQKRKIQSVKARLKAERSELKRTNNTLKKAYPERERIVNKANKALEKERELRNRLLGGKDTLVSGLTKEKQQLRSLVAEFNNVSKNLEDAKTALEDAKRAKDDAARSIRDQFTDLPDVVYEDINQVPINPLVGYVDALKKQVEATKKYKETLDKLRAAGLDDTTYQKLLDEGVGGQAFADSILAGGATAIESLNTLDKQLLDEATGLANNASAKLYDAGIQAAQGLVDGLTSKQSEIYQVMIGLADAMVKSIKKKLKIKSPSEAFAEMGKFTILGMVRGLDKSSGKVISSITTMSQEAMDTMRKKMALVSRAVTDEINPNPTITPILDLTNVQNGSKLLQNMFSGPGLNAGVSFGQAAVINLDKFRGDLGEGPLVEQAGIKFEQNNYSPENLSEIDIYRQTKNLLAQARPVIERRPVAR